MYKSIRVAAARSSLIAVAAFEGESSLARGIKLSPAEGKAVQAALKSPAFKGEAGEILPIGSNLLLVGLGRKDDLKRQTLRNVGGRLVRALDRMETKAVRLVIAEGISLKSVSASDAGRALAEGIALANWRVDIFDGSATKHEPQRPSLTLDGGDKQFKDGMKEGLTIASCVNEARRLAATPPNICNPPWVAKEAKKLAQKADLTCRVITYAEAKKLGMGGIVNVGKGSDAKPCLIIVEYIPTKAKKSTKLALVGKTMTYDTGGYSLKPGASMKGMKYDGNGGCAVLGAMLAIAALKVPVHVVALLPCAENMVSGDSYRPDDIITMYNKVSVEVTNTDAEGRLILGDALAYACTKYKPTAIIDAATLTGGVVIALGSWCAGMFCNDDDLRDRIDAAAHATDERVWRLPLWEEHRDFMRARHADIWNSGPKRDGHPLQGAAFLSYFVDESIPWAHLDIAGTSATETDTDLFVTGPTGFGVRLLTEVARGYA